MARLAEIDDCVNLSGSINNNAGASLHGNAKRSSLQPPTGSVPSEAYGESMTNPKNEIVDRRLSPAGQRFRCRT